MTIPVFRFFFSNGAAKDFEGCCNLQRVLSENRFALFGFTHYTFFCRQR